VLVDTAAIAALLAQTEIATGTKQVDRDFRAGLDAYYAGRYTESIERFDSVLAIIPSHIQAHAHRDEAQSRRAQQGGGASPAPDFWDWLDHFINGQSGSLVGIGVLIAIVLFLVRRRRPPHNPAASTEAPITPPTTRTREPHDSDRTNG
jgi:hypothetical protein